MRPRLFEMAFSIFSLFSVLLILLTSCAHSEKKEPSSVVSLTENRIATLEAELSEQKTELRRLSAAIEVISINLQEASGKNVKKSPNLPMSQLKTPGPRERVREQDNEESAAKSVGNDIAAVSESVGEGKDSAESVDEEADEEGDVIVADSRHEGMHWYLRGVEQLKKGEFDQAVDALRTFLNENPNHVYADRAEFLITNAHFLNREFGLVIVGTNLLESRYPSSFKLPDALYQKALSYLGLGQREEAKSVLKELLRRFPKQYLAKPASRKLAELSVTQDGSHGHVPLLDNSQP